MPAFRHADPLHAPLSVIVGARLWSVTPAPAFTVQGSPAVLSMAVRGYHEGRPA